MSVTLERSDGLDTSSGFAAAMGGDMGQRRTQANPLEGEIEYKCRCEEEDGLSGGRTVEPALQRWVLAVVVWHIGAKKMVGVKNDGASAGNCAQERQEQACVVWFVQQR